MRIVIAESTVDEKNPNISCLRPSLVQAIAMVELMKLRWCEPPDPRGNDYSTFVQQLLSMVAGDQAVPDCKAHKTLCVSGPFRKVNKKIFSQLIENLAQKDVLKISENRVLTLGEKGAKITRRPDFYAAFRTPVEFRLIAEEREIGTLPITSAVKDNSTLIFAGHSWRIDRIDENKRIIFLLPAKDGEPPIFPGEGILVHHEVRRKMLEVYRSEEVPNYLDDSARELLNEGRSWFKSLDLNHRSIVPFGGNGSALFPWVGDRIMHTLFFQLFFAGVSALPVNYAIIFPDRSPDEVKEKLKELNRKGFKLPVDAAFALANKCKEKWDKLVPRDLLATDYALRFFDEKGTREILRRIIEDK